MSTKDTFSVPIQDNCDDYAEYDDGTYPPSLSDQNQDHHLSSSIPFLMQVVAPKLDHGMVGKFEVSGGQGWGK